MLVLGHQSVSQSGSPIGRKFCGNLLKAFRVDLKAYLGLVLPALSSSGKIGAGFWVIFFLWATPTPLWSLLYSTIVLYDTSLFGFLL